MQQPLQPVLVQQPTVLVQQPQQPTVLVQQPQMVPAIPPPSLLPTQQPVLLQSSLPLHQTVSPQVMTLAPANQVLVPAAQLAASSGPLYVARSGLM